MAGEAELGIGAFCVFLAGAVALRSLKQAEPIVDERVFECRTTQRLLMTVNRLIFDPTLLLCPAEAKTPSLPRPMPPRPS